MLFHSSTLNFPLLLNDYLLKTGSRHMLLESHDESEVGGTNNC